MDTPLGVPVKKMVTTTGIQKDTQNLGASENDTMTPQMEMISIYLPAGMRRKTRELGLTYRTVYAAGLVALERKDRLEEMQGQVKGVKTIEERHGYQISTIFTYLKELRGDLENLRAEMIKRG